MADTFTLSGRYAIRPPVMGVNAPSITVDLSDTFSVLRKAAIPILLGADPAEAVLMGDIASASLVIIHTDAKVTARFTSADGATQAIPVDGLLILKSLNVPITALTLQRQPGVATNVQVIMAEKV